MADPVLAFPDHAKPFEVHTDASDYAIGGVLMQARGHPIAYKSRKLNDTERKYKVQAGFAKRFFVSSVRVAARVVQSQFGCEDH
ncbi:hypothetical protein VitviT2T_028999 [Vitis vinifera]|uniref:Reverse transcriptase/retrotransposon-derived protein RNase H-like domain-containing protein n=1 Tax=Vitis vinifera TaxID=29760 RepID=A0ABY9DYL2_VITVI|nr:hypothetical protein VitviT2T_028999 [Vitis vinifera]